MLRSHSDEVLEVCAGKAGPSTGRRGLVRSFSDNHLDAGGKLGGARWDEDFASDFATAVMGLQGESAPERERPRLGGHRRPSLHSAPSRRGLLESLVVAVGLSPPDVITLQPCVQFPGETPQSRQMRNSLLHFGPSIAANALEAAAPPRVHAPPEPCSPPGSCGGLVRDEQDGVLQSGIQRRRPSCDEEARERRGEQFRVDDSSPVGSWTSSSDAENRAPLGNARKRERTPGGPPPSRTGSSAVSFSAPFGAGGGRRAAANGEFERAWSLRSLSNFCPGNASVLKTTNQHKKVAHIRVPRYASKVLMMSLVGQTTNSIHG
jgi:hypothetical protein